MTIRRILLVSILSVSAIGLSAATAAATPAEGDVVRTDLGKGTTDAPVAINTNGAQSTLYVQQLLLKPAASSGWHTHSGPEYSVIAHGSVALQTGADCAVTTFGEGEAVFIPAGVPHRVANDGAADAEVIVTYTLPADDAVRIDAPDVCQK